MEVPDTIKQEADRCPHNFSCLPTGTCGDPAQCKVNASNGKNVLYLASKERISCPYHLPFGDGYICTCPVHYYLHNQGHSYK